jgi:hypothetical protein
LKRTALILLGALILTGVVRAQEAQVLAQNDQIKIEVTQFREACSDLVTSKEHPNPLSANMTCTELAITNNSRMPITAWVATRMTESPRPTRRAVETGIRAEDAVLFGGDSRNNREILPRDTHRVLMGNPTRVDFRAAIFEDGSVFGEPEWVQRLVQNRRQVYQDAAEALQKLRAAQQEGMPREQIIQEFQERERDERAKEEQSRLHTLAGPERLRLPKLGIFEMVAMNLRGGQTPGSEGLVGDLNRLDSMLLGIANRLLVAKPPISDHPTGVGEPLDSAGAVGQTRKPEPTH